MMSKPTVTLDSNLQDQAYPLFIEEALELLQQIQEMLLELPHDISLNQIHSLVRAISTIESGAAAVNLVDIRSIASRFEQILRRLWQEKILVDTEIGDWLWQAYECLRQSLSEKIHGDREGATDSFTQVGVIFARLENCLARHQDNQKKDERLDEREDSAAEFLEREVTQALAALEKLLSDGERQASVAAYRVDFLEKLNSQIETFLRLGDVLEIAEFVAVAQITIATLQINPKTARPIGKLAFTSFQGIWEATVNCDRQELPEITIEPLIWQDEPESSPAPQPSAQQSEPTGKRTCDRQITIQTEKSLVWQSDSVLFTLASEKIQEMLVLPPAEKHSAADERQWLSWCDRQIPIYRLGELLEYNHLSNCGTGGSYPGDDIALILDCGEETIAVELAVDRVLSLQEIAIEPFGAEIAPPDYCYGCTILKDDRLAVVIDVEALLEQSFSTSKRSTLPTILAIDDSNTSRHLVVLALEKAGYRVLQARDGEEGLQIMRQNRDIALVVSDIEMPKLNGFGFLQSCHQDRQLASVPVILLSSYKSDRHRQMAKELGAKAYLVKPLDEERFLATLDVLLPKS
jgi:chemotaxis protein histidine kinase CheA